MKRALNQQKHKLPGKAEPSAAPMINTMRQRQRCPPSRAPSAQSLISIATTGRPPDTISTAVKTNGIVKLRRLGGLSGHWRRVFLEIVDGDALAGDGDLRPDRNRQPRWPLRTALGKLFIV